MNFLKKIFKKEKTYTNKEIALEIANYLFTINENNTYKTSILLRSVNEKPSKSCTVDNIEKFKEKMDSIEGIIKYELLVKWISDNTSKTNMIQTKIDLLDNKVNIKYQNEENIDFLITKVNEIKSKLENMGITPTIEEKIKEEPKIELVSLGILGEYNIYDINYESNTSEQEYQKTKEIMNRLEENITKINNELFYNIITNLDCVVDNLWEDKSFGKIIDIEKLPQEFTSSSDEIKHEILFNFKENITKKNVIEITKEEKPFWNIDNIKNDLIIKNVLIEEEYNNLIIEFDGILDCFIAYVEIDTINYVIKNFDPS